MAWNSARLCEKMSAAVAAETRTSRNAVRPYSKVMQPIRTSQNRLCRRPSIFATPPTREEYRSFHSIGSSPIGGRGRTRHEGRPLLSRRRITLGLGGLAGRPPGGG